jgi:hypothetical protein
MVSAFDPAFHFFAVGDLASNQSSVYYYISAI